VPVDRNASTYGYLLGAAGHILGTFDRINLDEDIARRPGKCQRRTFVLYAMRFSKKKSASGLTIEFIVTCNEFTCSPCCLTYSYAACSFSKSG
jgi:hypothetical protein